MQSGWIDFLRSPADAGHAVQIYAELDELAESVAGYLATGFAGGEPAVVVATRDHQETFARFLAATGWDADVLVETGLLTILDAEQTLASFLVGEEISARLFEEIVGGVIDRTAERFPGRHVRAFGEMVDLLSADGKHDMAAALERLWNELAKSRRFSLLCGYRLDVFDPAAQAATLPAVCSSHTHVMPAYDMDRLDRAVHDALEEVLGSSSARMVHGIVSDDADAHSAPLSEQVLMWMSDRMPKHAERVLSVARAKYKQVPASAG